MIHVATQAARYVWRRSPWALPPEESIKELRQIAFLATLKSHWSFDPSRRFAYGDWIWWAATGAGRNYLHEQMSLRVLGGTWAGRPRVWRNLERLRAAGRTTTPKAVAQETGLPVETVQRIVAGHASGFILYFPATGRAGQDGSVHDPLTAQNLTINKRDAEEMELAVYEILTDVPPPERRLLWMYYAEGVSQAGIARRFGITQKVVRRSLAQAMRRLRGMGVDHHVAGRGRNSRDQAKYEGSRRVDRAGPKNRGG